mgnify:FL=1
MEISKKKKIVCIKRDPDANPKCQCVPENPEIDRTQEVKVGWKPVHTVEAARLAWRDGNKPLAVVRLQKRVQRLLLLLHINGFLVRVMGVLGELQRVVIVARVAWRRGQVRRHAEGAFVEQFRGGQFRLLRREKGQIQFGQ